MSWWLSLLTGAGGGAIGAAATAWVARRNSEDAVAQQNLVLEQQRREAVEAGRRWSLDFDAAQQRWQGTMMEAPSTKPELTGR